MAKPKNISNEIHRLRNLGYSYNEIMNELKCSKSTISYHLGDGQKIKTLNRTKKIRFKQHPFKSKIDNFVYNKYYNKKSKTLRHNTYKLLALKIQVFSRSRKTGKNSMSTFTVQDVTNKFGENPKCALTGEPIDINKPRTYQFDHILPVSRGGDNSLDNLQICTKQANQAKHDLTNDEFIQLCKQVLTNNGYELKKLQD